MANQRIRALAPRSTLLADDSFVVDTETGCYRVSLNDLARQLYPASTIGQELVNAALTTIRDSVATEGNTLAKLYALINGLNIAGVDGLEDALGTKISEQQLADAIAAVEIEDLDEDIFVRMGEVLVEGDNITLTIDATAKTITIDAAGGGGGELTDGDKGDITVDDDGAEFLINDEAVTLPKLAHIASGSLLGRANAGTGDVEELAASGITGLLSVFTGAGGGSEKGLVPDPGPTPGTYRFLRDNGAWAEVTAQDDSITNAKLANVATATFKGRHTAGTGDPEDMSPTQATSLLNAVVGDSGSGGTKGVVPAPAAGDAAAKKVLGAGGGYVTPSVYNRQVFTASGTWTKPPYASLVRLTIQGWGGPGGGGAMAANGTAASGGGGGGGGEYKSFLIPASDLGATVAVTIGSAPVPGVGATVAGDGSQGTRGGTTSFGSFTVGPGGAGAGGRVALNSGGGGGAGFGAAGNNASGSSGGPISVTGQGAGGSGTSAGLNGNSTMWWAGGGGGGGGSPASAGAGGSATGPPGGGAGGSLLAAGATSPGGGGTRFAPSMPDGPGPGGTGGAGSYNGTAPAGTIPTGYGGGGGGGGSGTNGGGAGGNGAPSRVVVEVIA